MSKLEKIGKIILGLLVLVGFGLVIGLFALLGGLVAANVSLDKAPAQYRLDDVSRALNVTAALNKWCSDRTGDPSWGVNFATSTDTVGQIGCLLPRK